MTERDEQNYYAIQHRTLPGTPRWERLPEWQRKWALTSFDTVAGFLTKTCTWSGEWGAKGWNTLPEGVTALLALDAARTNPDLKVRALQTYGGSVPWAQEYGDLEFRLVKVRKVSEVTVVAHSAREHRPGGEAMLRFQILDQCPDAKWDAKP